MTESQIADLVVSTVRPLVASRVYARTFVQPNGKLPPWPAAMYLFVSATPTVDVCGDGGEEVADYRIQIDVADLASKGETSFLTLCSAVRSAMGALPAFIFDGQFDTSDSETKTSRRSFDYLIFLSSPD